MRIFDFQFFIKMFQNSCKTTYLKTVLNSHLIIFILTICFGNAFAQNFKSQRHELTLTGNDTIHFDYKRLPGKYEVSITNADPDNEISFTMRNLNASDYTSATALLRSVIKDEFTPHEKAVALWRVVSISGHHKYFDAFHSLKDPNDPMALNRYPVFMCGEKSGILTNLALLAGFSDARRVSLNGHEVTEIFYDNAYHMFDADRRCYFTLADGSIASTQALASYPDIIRQQAKLFHEKFPVKEYIRQISSYGPASIAHAHSMVIHDYRDKFFDITLWAGEHIHFRFDKVNSNMFEMSFPGFYKGAGTVVRKVLLLNSNTYLRNDTLICRNILSYQTTSLKVLSEVPLNVHVYFRPVNAENGKTEWEYLGNLLDKKLERKFNLADGEFYYDYEIMYTGCKPDMLPRFSIVKDFNFNGITFPFHEKGPVLISTVKSTSLHSERLWVNIRKASSKKRS